jgi:hypothetical protein
MQISGHTRRSPEARELEALGAYLRSESAAAQSYREIAARMGSLPESAELRDCMRSHENRAMRLREEIRRRGGRATDAPAPWAEVARFIAASASGFDVKIAIGALEDGEDDLRDSYQDALGALTREGRILVEQFLLPEQLRTHAVVSRLKRMLP